MVRERRANLLLAPGRSIRLLLRTDFKDRAVATKARAKVNHRGVGDTSKLLASQGRERVSVTTGLDILDEITHRGKDPRDVGHHSPNP